MSKLYSFPEEDKSPDVPREPYIRLSSLQSSQTRDERGDKHISKPEVKNYYYPIGGARYDTISNTGARAILALISKRERRGHTVTGFGNFPETPNYIGLARDLKKRPGLQVIDPENPLRKQIEAELSAGKKGAKKDEKGSAKVTAND